MVVCVGLASFWASSRLTGWTLPVRGDRFLLRAYGCIGYGRWDGVRVLCFELSVGRLHVLDVRQVAPCGSCSLCEVLVEEPIFRPRGELQERGVVCPTAVHDPRSG